MQACCCIPKRPETINLSTIAGVWIGRNGLIVIIAPVTIQQFPSPRIFSQHWWFDYGQFILFNSSGAARCALRAAHFAP
jgi:hypothetical protein